MALQTYLRMCLSVTLSICLALSSYISVHLRPIVIKLYVHFGNTTVYVRWIVVEFHENMLSDDIMESLASTCT